MAVRGDEPLKIMQRAGHTDFKTTQIYVREAESVRQGFGVPFPDLPTSLFGAGAEERSHGPGGGKGSNGAERFETKGRCRAQRAPRSASLGAGAPNAREAPQATNKRALRRPIRHDVGTARSAESSAIHAGSCIRGPVRVPSAPLRSSRVTILRTIPGGTEQRPSPAGAQRDSFSES